MSKFPKWYSETAKRIISEKYLDEEYDTAENLFDRIAFHISVLAERQGHIESFQDLYGFLYTGMLEQRFLFNSPVNFSCGKNNETNQVSACFILGLQDSMKSIYKTVLDMAEVYKGGSGCGINLSTLRSEGEVISTGGTSSGPMSFTRIFDDVAGSTKSGGKTRRAALMLLMDCDHPDFDEFITEKARQEHRAQLLVNAGVPSGFTEKHSAYDTVRLQNANLSARLTDEFVDASFNKSSDEYRKLRLIAQSAWECGDPGVQYHDTINKSNTCASSGTITGSNPCSEFLFLDNSACNLASLNLMKFSSSKPGTMKWDHLAEAVKNLVIAMDAIIDSASYPTDEIKQNSIAFRPIGLGYANLGALLMSWGIPYDSDQAREFAARVTSFIHVHAMKTSNELAKKIGPFSKWKENEEHVFNVLFDQKCKFEDLFNDHSIKIDFDNGMRNAQLTLLAPTGTIGLAMGCESTGIEPVAFMGGTKTLVASDNIEFKIPDCAVRGLKALKLGYDVLYESSAFETSMGKNTVSAMGHLRMMEAVQPFLSGAISKTVNLPGDATVDDIVEIYQEAWKKKLKAIAVYRDGSKGSQPLNAESNKNEAKECDNCSECNCDEIKWGQRKRLSSSVASIRHKFKIAGRSFYLHVGFYEDGNPAELFMRSDENNTFQSLLDQWCVAVSFALQYGAEYERIFKKFMGSEFSPQGWTSLPAESGMSAVKSVIDYISKYMINRRWDFSIIEDLMDQDAKDCKKCAKENQKSPLTPGHIDPIIPTRGALGFRGKTCSECGSPLVPDGICGSCPVCGGGGCGA